VVRFGTPAIGRVRPRSETLTATVILILDAYDRRRDVRFIEAAALKLEAEQDCEMNGRAVRAPCGRHDFFWDDNPGRASITRKMNQEQAREVTEDLAREELNRLKR